MDLALTHRSYVAEHDVEESNERLEFLGDAVVGLAVTDYSYEFYEDLPEGELAKLRASVVNTVSLATVGRAIGLGSFLRLGKGEDSSGGRDKESILADAFEAVIGAVFVDGGWEPARTATISLLSDAIRSSALRPGGEDFKTRLQELTSALQLPAPSYLLSATGPDHDRRFLAYAYLGDDRCGEGAGTSKKRAEQGAAEAAWHLLTQRQHGGSMTVPLACYATEETHG